MKFKSDSQRKAVFSRLNRFSLYLKHDIKEDEYFIKSDEYPEVDVYLQGWGLKPEKAMEYFDDIPDEDLIGFKRMDFFSPKEFRKGYPHRQETSFYTNYSPGQSDQVPIAVINTKGGKKHAVHDLMHEIGHHLDIGGEPAKENTYLRNIMLDFPADSYARILNPNDKLGRHTDWADEKAEEMRGLSEAKGLTFDEANKYIGDEKFSFDERKRRGYYPADSNLPDEFDTIVLNTTFNVLRDKYGHYNPDDELDKSVITGLVCEELNKQWKPEWGKRPDGHYLKADVEDALERLR